MTWLPKREWAQLRAVAAANGESMYKFAQRAIRSALQDALDELTEG